MKTIVILAAASLALVGCNKEDRSMNESAGAQKDQIEQSKETQKDALNQQKKDLNRTAKAEKEQIDSQTADQKAQLDAQKKQVEDQAANAKSDVQQKVDEAAGAATTQLNALDQGTSEADRKITQQVRQSIVSTLGADNSTLAKNITIITKDGKVTLKGMVNTDAEKKNLEEQAKAAPGVTSVDNQLEVK